MGITIIGPEGKEIAPKREKIQPGYDMPEDEVNPGLEIIKPDMPLSKTPPFPIPFNIPPVKRDIDEILGNN
jgi:hypothetical protein